MPPAADGGKPMLASILNESPYCLCQDSAFRQVEPVVTAVHQPISKLEQSLEGAKVDRLGPTPSTKPEGLPAINDATD